MTTISFASLRETEDTVYGNLEVCQIQSIIRMNTQARGVYFFKIY